jgi:SMI1 / KNR4 family (SUKH-1)
MKLLLDSLAKNYSVSVPATLSGIAAAESVLIYSLPADYKDFLLMTDGLEGAGDHEYLVLWSSKELIELNAAYHVKEFVPNVIIFGSDGAEEAYGFDISVVPASIVKLPFIGMGYVPNERLAGSFEEFLSMKIPVTFFN